MSIYTKTLTLVLVMDPLGNIPIFLSILKSIDAKRRMHITLRECVIAFVILSMFLFFGENLLEGLGISQAALSIAGGIILFLISLKMIFPTEENEGSTEKNKNEPFIVPLAIPLVAGPSAIATVMLFGTQEPGSYNFQGLVALIIASTICTCLLLIAPQLQKILKQKGLIAMERLMGMILTTISVQMFLTGIDNYFHLH